MLPKISVIIPVYNTEHYLEKCLNSVVNQSYQEIEIIVVDDCSSGNCKEIVENYRVKDSRIVYEKHQENKGLFTARQTGVQKAVGEYILHLDSDDSATQNICEKLVQTLSQNPQSDFIQFGFITLHSEYQLKIKPQSNQNLKNHDIFDAVLDLSIEPYFIWRYLLKRELCLKVYEVLQIDQPIIHNEDVLFLVVYSYYCKHFCSIKYIGCIYNCMNLQSITRKIRTEETQYIQNLEQYQKVIFYLEQFFRNNNIDVSRLFKIKQEFCTFFLEKLKFQQNSVFISDILKKAMEIFGGDVFSSFLYDVSFNLSMSSILRKINSKIQKYYDQYLPEDSKQYIFFRKIWLWFKNK